MAFSKEQVLEALKQVSFPEKKQDIVSLGMVENIQITDEKISFSLLFPQFNNPFKKSMKKACKEAIELYLKTDILVDVLATSKVSVGRIDQKPEQKTVLPGVKNIIAIASGKGGVGKSTMTTNLAIGLAKTGAKVGLIDADVYGPSMPKMFGVEGARPVIERIDNKDFIVPIEKFGVKMLSIGFFVKPEDALIWRGAMATSALNQLISEGLWGELDYLLIDLPPGTGDIHLTMVQAVPVTGAVIVSTPQDVAVADAIKGISMFRANKIEVPILGLIENMAWFTPEELPENKYYIFGKNGVKDLAFRYDLPLLGQIPLVQSIREGSDDGQPAILSKSIIAEEFEKLTENLIQRIEERNAKLAPTKKVEMSDTAGCGTH